MCAPVSVAGFTITSSDGRVSESVAGAEWGWCAKGGGAILALLAAAGAIGQFRGFDVRG